MKDLPFRFGTLYICFGIIVIPLWIWIAIASYIDTNTILWSTISIFFAILYIAQSIGLYKRKYRALIIVYIWFVYSLFTAPIILYFLYSLPFTLFIKLEILTAVVNIPILIYFHKRRAMFD